MKPEHEGEYFKKKTTTQRHVKGQKVKTIND